jgi:hypothetical protein
MQNGSAMKRIRSHSFLNKMKTGIRIEETEALG